MATVCSKAAYLKGKEAGLFVRVYGPLVGEINHQQQTHLFRAAYCEKLEYAQRLYRHSHAKVPWEMLDRKVRDVVVDIIFQGFQNPYTLSRAAAGGKEQLIIFIRNDMQLMRFESQRKRIGYLL